MYGATFRITLQLSQQKAIKHAKRCVKYWEQWTVDGQMRILWNKDTLAELQWGNSHVKTVAKKDRYTIYLCHSPVKRRTTCIETNQVCTWTMRTALNTFRGLRRQFPHYSVLRDAGNNPGWPVGIKEELRQNESTRTFSPFLLLQGATNFPGTLQLKEATVIK